MKPDETEQLFASTFKEYIEEVEQVSPHGESAEAAFFVADMGNVYRQHLRWEKYLGRVVPHYGEYFKPKTIRELFVNISTSYVAAVKSNPDPNVLRLLADLGTGFDCCSKREMDQVLALGVDPSRIIYALPCKAKSHLRYAASKGITQMTFDGVEELHKTKEICPHAKLFLRIWTDDRSVYRLSAKFGAPPDKTDELLVTARKLGLDVVGVSFHIGSQPSDVNDYTRALEDSRAVFDKAEAIGFNLQVLDIGGGFTDSAFEKAAKVIRKSLDKYFPSHIRVIAEPGRYYVSSAFSLACSVIGRRESPMAASGSKSYMLFLNDGIYGNLEEARLGLCPTPGLLKIGGRFLYGQQKRHETEAETADTEELTEYSLWGPTCDGLDFILPSWIPRTKEMVGVGDWIYFPDMGAYSDVFATEFNGYNMHHKKVYVSSEPVLSAILDLCGHKNGVHQNGVHENGLHEDGVHENEVHENGVHRKDHHEYYQHNGVHA
ncbi:MAG: hypothetical protein M1816_006434 [Peltula sp. TS41687]|nr:MAG: hypothetical protein M1816_006434 [Peltula sp. TS41687]